MILQNNVQIAGHNIKLIHMSPNQESGLVSVKLNGCAYTMLFTIVRKEGIREMLYNQSSILESSTQKPLIESHAMYRQYKDIGLGLIDWLNKQESVADKRAAMIQEYEDQLAYHVWKQGEISTLISLLKAGV